MSAEGGAGGFEQVGIIQSIIEGGIVSISTALILVVMSVASWYIFFVKLLEQQKIIKETRKVRTAFWTAPNLKDGANRLDKNSAYRQIVDDGLRAEEQHNKLTNPIDQHDWMLGSLARSQGAITSKLGSGLAVLATVGSTAPFIGLFGTVVGIYGALLSIGASGQASIQAVAAPVGEALIQTALGLAVAVPAVMQYNWLMRRNKAIAEDLGRFTNDLHGYMMSAGQVKPQLPSAAPARPAAPAAGGRPTGGPGTPGGPGASGGPGAGGRPTSGPGAAGGPGAGGPGAATGAGTGATTRPTSGGPSISKT